MKRILFLLLAIGLLASPAFATVGIQDDGTDVGQAAAINVVGETTATFDGSTKTINLTAPTSITTSGAISTASSLTFRSALGLGAFGGVAASSTVASSSSAFLPSTMPYAVVYKAIGGANSNDNLYGGTLPNGTAGQVLVIHIWKCMASGSWTVTPVNSRGVWSSITFNARGQTAVLWYINDTLGWLVLSTGSTASSAQPTINYPTQS